MKRHFYLLLFFMLMAAFGNSAFAQDVKVEATLDKKSIPIGDQATLKLSIHFLAKDSVSLPVLKDTVSSKVSIVKVNKPDTSFAKDDVTRETISLNFVITSFDAGAYLIPPYTFVTKSGTFKTEPLELQVTAVKVDTTKAIYDIKQPIAVKYSFIDWLRDHKVEVGLGAAGLLVIIALIWYFKTRPKKVEEQPVVKVFVPVHKIALDKLTELRDKKLWQNEMVKEYYIELSDIIREYLEKRYAIQALEQTTDEIFASLKYMEITQADRNLLRQILILSDLVKFAKEKPLPSENELSLQNAMNFVTSTQEIVKPTATREQENDNELV